MCVCVCFLSVCPSVCLSNEVELLVIYIRISFFHLNSLLLKIIGMNLCCWSIFPQVPEAFLLFSIWLLKFFVIFRHVVGLQCYLTLGCRTSLTLSPLNVCVVTNFTKLLSAFE